MALTYDYTKVENADQVMFDHEDYMRGDTQGIIFSTMSTGMGEITEENWQEFYARLTVISKLRDWKVVSPARLQQHIGLTTNVAYETRLQWMKRWMNYEMDDILWKVRKECDTSSVH